MARAILQSAGTDLQFNLCGIAQRELASASHSNIICTPERVAGEQKSRKAEERAVHKSCAACGAACERTSAKFKIIYACVKRVINIKAKKGRREACV